MWRWISAVGVCVVAVLVWWFVGRSHDRTPSSPTSPPGTMAPSPTSSAEEPTLRAPVRRVTRVSPEQRQALRMQLERARVAQSDAASPQLLDAANSDVTADDNAMGTPQQVLQQVNAVLGEVRAHLAECRRYAPNVKSFTSKIVLFGDPDIGTLIDAPSELVGRDGQPFPPAFDDCVRGILQTLELPPMRIGEQFNVAFGMSFTDEESESPDRP